MRRKRKAQVQEKRRETKELGANQHLRVGEESGAQEKENPAARTW